MTALWRFASFDATIGVVNQAGPEVSELRYARFAHGMFGNSASHGRARLITIDVHGDNIESNEHEYGCGRNQAADGGGSMLSGHEGEGDSGPDR